jgi:hypothetical protein
MNDWRQRQFEKRCGNKRAYKDAEVADRKAEKASRKTKELIISYKCIDCGRWHIGHADQAQILARIPLEEALCVVCGKLIPERRLRKAKRYGTITRTCKPGCAHRLANLRRLERQRAQQIGTTGNLSTAGDDVTGTKGFAQPPSQVDENKPPDSAA